MSHLRRARLRRRSASDHERACRLAAERFDQTLGADEASWLAAHLDDCAACRSIALEYEEQHERLHALPAPEPPRDLWARTAAALDAEDRRAAGWTPGRRLPDIARAPLVPYGALAGVLVVAVVIGSSLLAGGGPVTPPSASGPPSPGLPTLLAAPTPVAVTADAVEWFAQEDDGTYALNAAVVDQVCPDEAQPDCAPIDGSARQLLRLTTAPRAVLRSPQQAQIVVVDAATASTGGSVYVVPIATASAPDTTPGSSQEPTGTPFDIASAPPTTEPIAPPTQEPSIEPTASPSAEPTPSTISSPEPTSLPEPSVAPDPGSPIAIISDVVVVGETASYSPDGNRFAFTARPGDGSQGPDIYVWQVGDQLAHPVTWDHASIFSSWLGDQVVGSRAAPDPVLLPPDPAAGQSLGGDTPAPSDATLEPPAEPTIEPTIEPTPGAAHHPFRCG